MKKKIMYAVACVALAAIAGWNYQQNQKEIQLSDLAIANIEAIASGESGSHCSSGCRSIGWGTSQVLKCDCSYTGLFSSCDNWGC